MMRLGRHGGTSRHGAEPVWPASLAVIAGIVLYVTLPDRLAPGPKWLFVAVEAALLIALNVTTPRRHHTDPIAVRAASLGLIALVNIANFVSLGYLVHHLLKGGGSNGRELILSAVQIWLTNVIIFGLWYWELDRGGPGGRTRTPQPPADFLFPQMSNSDVAPPNWRPTFVDYAYVSFTNATAFSPTDTMPLTPPVKALMAAQSLVSLITVALVAARAVNILN